MTTPQTHNPPSFGDAKVTVGAHPVSSSPEMTLGGWLAKIENERRVAGSPPTKPGAVCIQLQSVDYLTVYFEDVPHNATHANRYLSIYRALDDNRIIGCGLYLTSVPKVGTT